MAISNKDYTSTTSNGYFVRIIVNQDSQSISSNQSVVGYQVQVGCGLSYSQTSKNTINASINGVSVCSGNYAINFTGLNQVITLKTGTITVGHNSDGSKSVAVSASYSPTLTGGHFPAGSMSVSGTYDLDKIARASSFTIPASTSYGSAMTIAISRADASFTHDITISLPNRSKTYTSVAISQVHTIDLEWLRGYTVGEEASGSVTVQTKQGSTLIGSAVTQTFKAPVPANIKPTVSVAIEKVDNSAYPAIASYPNPLTGLTKLTYKQTNTLQYDAGIKSIVWSAQDVSFSGDKVTFTPTVVSQTLTCTLTDTRNRVATNSITVTSVLYNKPTLSASFDRCTSAGVSNGEGEWLKFNPTYTYTHITNYNGISVYYNISTDPVSAGNIAVNSGAWTPALGNGKVLKTKAYTLLVRVTDSIGFSVSKTMTVPIAETMINFPASADRIAFGMFIDSANANPFQVGWDSTFYKNVELKGNLNGFKMPNLATTSGDTYWGKLVATKSDGVTEIGTYLDFHITSTGTNDYDGRLYVDPSNNLMYAKSGASRTVAMGELANGHFGLQNPLSTDSWIRTTSYGFLPYSTTSNTWIGHPDWKFAEGWFKKGYVDTLYVGGTEQGDYPNYVPVFSGDLNGIVRTCIVYTANATNQPANYCHVQTYARSGGETTQVAYSSGAAMWTRFRNSVGTWTAWTAK